MRQGKLIFAVMLLVVAMLGGLYLAGWLTLWLLDRYFCLFYLLWR